jgi:hypothetical protein
VLFYDCDVSFLMHFYIFWFYDKKMIESIEKKPHESEISFSIKTHMFIVHWIEQGFNFICGPLVMQY